MTNEEFNTFRQALFVAFPSLNEWLRDKSPDPQATMRVWRQALSECTLRECLAVVEAWSTGKLPPFEAYERDKVHLIVRSIIGLQRDRIRKQRELARSNDQYARKRSGEVGPMQMLTADSSSSACVEELKAPHRKMLNGELTPGEYAVIEKNMLVKHGIVKQ